MQYCMGTNCLQHGQIHKNRLHYRGTKFIMDDAWIKLLGINSICMHGETIRLGSRTSCSHSTKFQLLCMQSGRINLWKELHETIHQNFTVIMVYLILPACNWGMNLGVMQANLWKQFWITDYKCSEAEACPADPSAAKIRWWVRWARPHQGGVSAHPLLPRLLAIPVRPSTALHMSHILHIRNLRC